ncbi:MAG: RNA methyltransferase [Ruminococcaceae bacterium]|nr:RNA methyltransferase [Oscillospiraceae bacterium]
MNLYRTVTSRQNPFVKELCALSDKKKRRQTGSFRFDGVKLFEEAVKSNISLLNIVIREDVAESLEPLCEYAVECGLVEREGIVCVSTEVFEKISEEKSPEGVICVAKMQDGLHKKLSAEELLSELSVGEKILLAESLRDPGNLGTVMRSCSALGIDRLILTDDCADIYSPRTVRAAMGALFKQKTVTVPLSQMPYAIELLRKNGRRIYAAALHREALNIDAIEMSAGDAFVIGNEGHGLSEEVINACTSCAIIPMSEGAESLNAAAAAAICIWETVRKR